jgi:cytochrome b
VPKTVSGRPDDVAPAMKKRLVVWDLPTRAFHWLLVLALAASWWTAENRHMEWHRWSGYTILWLILLRVYWGVVGSSTARFANFIRGPRVILDYVRGGKAGAWRASIGHNPLGAISVVALLVLVLAQVGLGLFSVDVDGIESGPLALFISFEAGRVAAKIHHWNFYALLALIGLHLVAVAFYVIAKRQQLIGPMITGRRDFPEDVVEEATLAPWWRLVVGMVVAALIVWAVSIGFQF